MGVDRGILNAMKDHRKSISGPHFLMSADNPIYPEQNKLNLDHAAVLKHLKGAQYDAHEVMGHYGKPEKSIIIYKISPQQAEQLHSLAANLGQESSIYSTGKKHEMRYHHGEKAGQKVMGQGTTWHAQQPKDFYTTLPGGAGRFTHNFNEDMKKAEEKPIQSAAQPTPSIGLKPDNKVKQVAESYAKSKGIKLSPTPAVNVNPEHGKQIASSYEGMKHSPGDPAVQKAYGALINETMDQFNHIKNSGLKISKIKPGMANPYKNSKDVMHDIHNNNHLWFFPTEGGFGSEGSAPKDHPLLTPTKILHEGSPLLANDVFRIVHDYFGHAKEGHTFGPKGEHSAFLTHKQMYSPEAQKALATETMGQNNTVNFGKHGEENRKNPQKTVYADQKAGLLPENIVHGKWHHAA
jgi:hypothetical protein